MESSDKELSASRRNVLKTSALGMGALGAMSMVGATASPAGAADAPAAAAGSSDAFLKIDGIPGESQDSKHRDEIEVLAFSWGVSKDSGKADLQDFAFTTFTSKASPLLMVGSAKGTLFKKAVLTVRKAGETPAEFYKVTLEDCLISSYQTNGNGSDVPTEQVSLDFASVTFSYSQQGPDGKLQPPIVVTYP
jgi:type VI secretion system secreted protein Hcp